MGTCTLNWGKGNMIAGGGVESRSDREESCGRWEKGNGLRQASWTT